MVRMGTQRSAYCIETSDRTQDTYANASNTCLNVGRYLCNYQEFSMACNNNSWSTSAWRWVADPYVNDTAVRGGNGGCFQSSGSANITDPNPFRCCLR
jgi:hypothetical protein